VNALQVKAFSNFRDGLKPFNILHAFESVYPDESFTWHHFNLAHKLHVKTKLRATNGAYNTDNADTNGFIVDLTPPELDYIGDGVTPRTDIFFQSNSDSMSVNFGFQDKESGVKKYKVKFYEVYQDTKSLIGECKLNLFIKFKKRLVLFRDALQIIC
jgi:hypothetical protein